MAGRRLTGWHYLFCYRCKCPAIRLIVQQIPYRVLLAVNSQESFLQQVIGNGIVGHSAAQKPAHVG